MRKKLKDSFAAMDWSRPRRGVPRSGPGSTLEHTKNIRAALPRLFEIYGVKRFVDAPCGDWHWMQHVDLTGVDYIGLDIVEELIDQNQAQFSASNISFKLADITSDPLPKSDMLMCRDCLFHLKFWLRWAFFENFAASGTPYLLTTIHDNPVNRNVPANGKFRWFNPRIEPFNLPEPLWSVDDTPTGSQNASDFRKRRYMGVWHRDAILEALRNRDNAT